MGPAERPQALIEPTGFPVQPFPRQVRRSRRPDRGMQRHGHNPIGLLPRRSRHGSPSHLVAGPECGRRFQPATLGGPGDREEPNGIGHGPAPPGHALLLCCVLTAALLATGAAETVTDVECPERCGPAEEIGLSIAVERERPPLPRAEWIYAAVCLPPGWSVVRADLSGPGAREFTADAWVTRELNTVYGRDGHRWWGGRALARADGRDGAPAPDVAAVAFRLRTGPDPGVCTIECCGGSGPPLPATSPSVRERPGQPPKSRDQIGLAHLESCFPFRLRWRVSREVVLASPITGLVLGPAPAPVRFGRPDSTIRGQPIAVRALTAAPQGVLLRLSGNTWPSRLVDPRSGATATRTGPLGKGSAHTLFLETAIPAGAPVGATDGCVLTAERPGPNAGSCSMLVRTTARSGALALVGMHDRPEIALVDLELLRRVGSLSINVAASAAVKRCEMGEALAVSPDGRRVYALCRSLDIGRGFRLRCLDVDTGALVYDGVVDSPRKHDSPRQIALSEDERCVFIRCDRSLAAFSVADGTVVKRLPGDWVALVGNPSDGGPLVASRRQLFALGAADLALRPVAALPAGAGRNVAVAGAANRLYVGLGTDHERGTGVCLVDLRSGTTRNCFLGIPWQDVAAAPPHGRSLAFTSADPCVLAAGGESVAEQWSVPMPGPVTRAAFAPDGAHLVALVPGARMLALVAWSTQVVTREIGLGGVPTVEAFAVAVASDTPTSRPATRGGGGPVGEPRGQRCDDALRLAQYHGSRGQLERAVELAGRAATLCPGRIEPHRLRCLYSCKLGRIDDAIADLETILRVEPQNGWGLRKLAWIHVSEPGRLRPERAVPLAREALALREDGESRSILAFALALQGNFRQAVSHQERAYALTPRPLYREMLAALKSGITYHEYVSNAPAHFDYRLVKLGGSKVLGFQHEPAADGLVVHRVFAKTPAAAAGLRAGDVIALLDGTELRSGLVLNRQRDELVSGSCDRMLLVVFRGDRTLRLEVVR